jgi:hypothetical protein
VRDLFAALRALTIAVLLAGCGAEPWAPAPAPTVIPPATYSPMVATTPFHPDSATPICPPADGDGTVPPAISIYSITFLVNGAEQVLLDGDDLEALPGDRVEVREAVICSAPFSGDGGEACVDLVPVGQSGEEIASEHAGSHLVQAMPGTTTLPGPERVWTVSESWRGFSAVVNHWPGVETLDLGCASGDCERDDRMSVPIR